MPNIYCLMWSGSHLTDKLRTFLFTSAQELFDNKEQYQYLKTSWCEGHISTKWETAGLAGTFGYMFDAYIEWGNKSTTVQFICKETDLNPEDMAWIEYVNPINNISLN